MTHEDPIVLARSWIDQARASEPGDPDAAALATADAVGMPSVRMVLVKAIDGRGFVVYTNLGSRKARELEANPRASLCFHWKTLERQLRVEGHVERVSDEEADAYFASRPRGSQIGAWVSAQSSVISSRSLLEMKFEEIRRKFHDREVPLPSFWGGFRVVPREFEFWQGRPSRLHDRLLYTQVADGWTKARLSP